MPWHGKTRLQGLPEGCQEVHDKSSGHPLQMRFLHSHMIRQLLTKSQNPYVIKSSSSQMTRHKHQDGMKVAEYIEYTCEKYICWVVNMSGCEISKQPFSGIFMGWAQSLVLLSPASCSSPASCQPWKQPEASNDTSRRYRFTQHGTQCFQRVIICSKCHIWSPYIMVRSITGSLCFDWPYLCCFRRYARCGSGCILAGDQARPEFSPVSVCLRCRQAVRDALPLSVWLLGAITAVRVVPVHDLASIRTCASYTSSAINADDAIQRQERRVFTSMSQGGIRCECILCSYSENALL